MAEEVQELAEGTSQKVASRTELLQLIQKQEFRCALSGVELKPIVAALDHKLAVSSGGGHGVDNLQVVHSSINRMKGTLSNDDFIMWCRKVASWNA